MLIKDLNKIRNIIFEEFCKDEKVQDLFKTSEKVYVVEFSEKTTHFVDFFTNLSQVNKQYFAKKNLSENCYCKVLYEMYRSTKQAI